MARQLNQAQCGSVWNTNRLLPQSSNNRSSCQAYPATGGGGKINWPAGGHYWRAEPGPGGVLGAAALPRKGWQAEGAGGQG